MNNDNNLDYNSKGMNVVKVVGFIIGIIFFLPIFLYLILFIAAKLIFNNNMNINEMVITIEIVLGALIILLIGLCVYRKFKILRKIGKKMDGLNWLFLIFAIVLFIIILIKEFVIPIKFIDYTYVEYIDIKGEKIPTFYLASKLDDTYFSFNMKAKTDELGDTELAFINYRYVIVAQEGFINYKNILHENGYKCIYSYINGEEVTIYTEYAYYDEDKNQSVIIEIHNNDITYTVIEGNYNEYAIYKEK